MFVKKELHFSSNKNKTEKIFLSKSAKAEPGISGLEKTAPSGELEFSSRSN